MVLVIIACISGLCHLSNKKRYVLGSCHAAALFSPSLLLGLRSHTVYDAKTKCLTASQTVSKWELPSLRSYK